MYNKNNDNLGERRESGIILDDHMKKLFTILIAGCLLCSGIHVVHAADAFVTIFETRIEESGYYKIESDQIVEADEDTYELKITLYGENIDIDLNGADLSDTSISCKENYDDNFNITLNTIADSKIGNLFGAYNVTLTGDAFLQLNFVNGAGTNHDTFTIAEGTEAQIEDLNIGASGGTDGRLVVAGTLSLGSFYGGCAEIKSTGTLMLYNHMTLNGVSGDRNAAFTGLLQIESGGVFIADSEVAALRSQTYHVDNFDSDSLMAEDVFVMPDHYLPEDMSLAKGMTGYGTLFFTIVEDSVDTESSDFTYEDGAKSFHLAQRYTIDTVNCTSSHTKALPGETVTLTPDTPEAGYEFAGYETDAGTSFTENEMIMGAQNVIVTAVFEPIKMKELSLNKDTLEFSQEGSWDTLIATYSPADAVDTALVWSSSDENVATVDQNGVVTAVGAGTAVVKVENIASGLSDTCEVTVDVPYTITGVNCTPDVEEALAGTTINLTPDTPQAGYEFSHYESDEVTITEHSFIMPEEHVTVTAVFTKVKADKITLDKEELTFDEIGDSEDLNASVEPVDVSDSELIWESSDEAVVTVDEDGVVTVIGEGSAVITVKDEESGLSASCDVTVKLQDKNDGEAGGSEQEPEKTPEEEPQEDPQPEKEQESEAAPEEEPQPEKDPETKPEPEPEKPESEGPPTSDTTNLSFYISVLLLSGAMFTLLLKKDKKA